VYIRGMNDDQKHAMAKDILSSELKKRLYLYSYIFLIVLSVVDLVIFIIALVVDAQDSASRMPSLICSYVGIAFAVINLFLIAILSALYFVQPDDEVSFARIKAVNHLRVALRAFGLASGVTLIVSSFLGLAGGSDKPFNTFAKGWGIAITAIEGVMFIYALWHNAWIRENPEKYTTPVYPLKGEEKTTKAPAKKEEKEPVSKEKSIAPETEVVEVEAHYQKPAQITHDDKTKKNSGK
jgi:hypothetical protein